MLAHVVGVVREVTDRLVVSVKGPDDARRLAELAGHGTTWLIDRPELGGAGPAAGMLTALHDLGTEELLFAPGDMPWLTAEALRGLLSVGKERGPTAAAPLRPGGWAEPLVQWQRVEPWRGRIGTLPDRGGAGARPTDLLRGAEVARLVPVALLASDPRCFLNVNAPGDDGSAPRLDGRPLPAAPVTVSEAARQAFWAGAALARQGRPAETAHAFEAEAAEHSRAGLGLFRMHALEDALRYARVAGLSLDQLEARLADARRTLGA